MLGASPEFTEGAGSWMPASSCDTRSVLPGHEQRLLSTPGSPVLFP